jgi:hypothetical protein
MARQFIGEMKWAVTALPFRSADRSTRRSIGFSVRVAQQFPQPVLERHIGRRASVAIQPLFEILDSHLMLDPRG